MIPIDILFYVVLLSIVISGSIASYEASWKSDIIDITRSCSEGKAIDKFLPHGMGKADADVSFISPTYSSPPDCLIHYQTTGDLFMCFILVVELTTTSSSPAFRVCLENTTLIKLVTHSGEYDVCEELLKHESNESYASFRKLVIESSTATLNITTTVFHDTLKITATSALKVNSEDDCNEDLETPCIILPHTLCISKELRCDKNINCGLLKSYDEDYRICEATGYAFKWLIVLASVIMLLILLCFLLNLLYMILPHVPDNFFIFNEDEDNRLILASQLQPPSGGYSTKQITLHTPPEPQLSIFSEKGHMSAKKSVHTRYIHSVSVGTAVNIPSVALLSTRKAISSKTAIHSLNENEERIQEETESLDYIWENLVDDQSKESTIREDTEQVLEKYSLFDLEKQSPAFKSASYEDIIQEIDQI